MTKPHQVLLLAGVAMCLASPAAQGAESDIRRGYDQAQRCYVANGYLSTTFKKRGDTANAELFDAKAERAFKTANGYAVFLKLSREQIERDYDDVTERELQRLVKEQNYLTAVAKECKAGGLM